MLGLFKSPCFSIFKANPLDFSHQNIYNSQVIQYAGVAELADAPDLGKATLRELTCSATKSAWHTHNYRFCYRHDTWQLLSFYIIVKKFAISHYVFFISFYILVGIYHLQLLTKPHWFSVFTTKVILFNREKRG